MKKISILIIGVIILCVILVAYVTNNKQENTNMNYEIITDRSIINQLKVGNDDRGYELIEQDNFYYVIIHYGEQPSYYSTLKITKVEIDGKKVKITVALPKDEGMGDAFSYPKAIIRFDQKPEKIDISYK